MAAPDRQMLPAHLLASLDDEGRRAVLAPDPVQAATAMLDVVETLPPFTSRVALRSAWLGQVRELVVQLGDRCPDALEVRMLTDIARTAFAARETTAGFAAADHALARAVDAGDLAAQVAIRAARLPFLAASAPVEAASDARQLDAALQALGPNPLPTFRDAEVHLGYLAWYGATGDFQRLRRELAAVGRLQLPRSEYVHFLAYASHAALGQLYLRSRQRVQAALALIEAAKVTDDQGAWAELGNLQAVVVAIAMQAGDFATAVAHARSAVDAASHATCQHAQPDPWLGFPLDIGLVDSCAGAVQSLAEAVLHAQDLGDATGFLVAASAMAGFYLADDRALEALDALTEAAEVARSLDDDTVAPILRGEAEALLSHLGILRR